MFPFWFILGIVMLVAGLFNRQILKWLGSRPNSEIFVNPGRRHSSKIVEQMGGWLAFTLGLSFMVLGLGNALPVAVSSRMLFILLGATGLMLLAMIIITVFHWKTK
jgi:hypothetical protein